MDTMHMHVNRGQGRAAAGTPQVIHGSMLAAPMT